MNIQQQRALDRTVAVAKSVRERIAEQLKFARELCIMHPDQAGRFEPLIAEAQQKFDACVSGGDLSQLEPTATAIEALLAPLGPLAKSYTLHCVGHAHIDMNWMWGWAETVAVCNDTFLTALGLMDEFPGFTLSQSQGAVYEIVRRYNPELFERIKKRVADGSWEITAAAWVEADKNLSNGESLGRHLLYTRQFMKEHFGLSPEDLIVQWEPDTFGHAHTIPSIVSRGGVRCYYLCRPGEIEVPPVFWFQGPDGARVLVSHETTWYSNTINPAGVHKLIDWCKKTHLRDCLFMYGVGDHGGGPTRRDLRRREEMDAWPIYPQLRFSTTRRYFELLLEQGDRWPTLDRELNFEFAGCYTSQSQIKRANRVGENMMAEAEIAATLAHGAVGRDYPAESIKAAWLDVLFNQFHDILPGSGVPATRTCALGMFQNVQAAAGMIKTHSLRAIVNQIDTTFARVQRDASRASPPAHESPAFGAGAGRLTAATRTGTGWRLSDHQLVSSADHTVDGGRATVIFNPTAWKREEIAVVTAWEGEAAYVELAMKDRKFIARTADGQALPTQVIGADRFAGHPYVDLAVPVSVGPMAYTTLAIEEVTADAMPSVPAERAAKVTLEHEGSVRFKFNQPLGKLALENERLLVEFDRVTGGVRKLFDKVTGRDLACGDDPLGLLEYVVERPTQMSAWVLGEQRSRQFPLDVEWVRPMHQGPWVTSVNAAVRVGQSRLDVSYILRSGSNMLEIEVGGEWLERGSASIGTPKLLMRMPLNLANPKARYEIPFGSIQRDHNNGREVPALRWVDVRSEDGKAGACLVNDCKYGHSLDGSILRQTLIRSSYQPDPLPEMAEHRMRMAIVPHGGDVPVAELMRWGAAFNHPLMGVNTGAHGGPSPATAESVLACDGAGAVITQIKLAEDGDGMIIRLLETEGKKTTARVTVNPALLGKVGSVRRVDLLERDEANVPAATAMDDGFSLPLSAHEIASVRVQRANA